MFCGSFMSKGTSMKNQFEPIKEEETEEAEECDNCDLSNKTSQEWGPDRSRVAHESETRGLSCPRDVPCSTRRPPPCDPQPNGRKKNDKKLPTPPCDRPPNGLKEDRQQTNKEQKESHPCATRAKAEDHPLLDDCRRALVRDCKCKIGE